MREWTHGHSQGLRAGLAQWEGIGSGQVDREDGLKGRRETSNQPPQGNTASGPSGRGSPPHPHTPVVVLPSGVPTSPTLSLGSSFQLPTGLPYPTSPAGRMTPPTHPTRGFGHSIGHILLSFHFTESLPASTGITEQNVSEPTSGKALRSAGISNATSIL